MSSTIKRHSGVSRRSFMAGAAAACAGTCLSSNTRSARASELKPDIPPEDYRIQNGRIRQSVYGWCFNPMPAEELIEACHRMGIPSMDVGRNHYPMLKRLGMKLTMGGGHGFKKGPFSRDNHEYCIEKLRAGIDGAVECECAQVITFTGMREEGIADEQGAKNCVDCWKAVIGYAEEKGVNLCLEILNTRDDTHPMKGHPGYFGDDVDLCIDLIKRVDSPRMKLLFDVYHVQVMNGDVIRRIRQYKDYIGHYHVAGVPGRAELDDTQEVNYPAVMRAILETGYTGLVSQEFIPTWPDKLAALRHAVRVCDV
ncbi:MAG: TIM barrel protein [Planctomycetes bacterium]|nr:TIM barrel protein [Planctomycetota bacterium]MBL7040668.1 TIM barrel protein [Pirellulaceae bacterium]